MACHAAPYQSEYGFRPMDEPFGPDLNGGRRFSRSSEASYMDGPVSIAGGQTLRELTATIVGVLCETGGIEDLRRLSSSRQLGQLQHDGRRFLARALGLTTHESSLGPSASPVPPLAARGRSTSPGGRRRATSRERGCSQHRLPELDGPTTAEACRLLNLDCDPFPFVNRVSAASLRLLVVCGVLGNIAFSMPQDPLGRASEWAIQGIGTLLTELSATRITDADAAAIVCGGFGRRSLGNAAQQSNNPQLGGDFPQVGDAVLAHWPLPDGSPSIGVEDAEILALSQELNLVRLRYADGLVWDVPLDWLSIGRVMRRTGFAANPLRDLEMQQRLEALEMEERQAQLSPPEVPPLPLRDIPRAGVHVGGAGAGAGAVVGGVAGGAIGGVAGAGGVATDAGVAVGGAVGRPQLEMDTVLCRLLENEAKIPDICERIRDQFNRQLGAGIGGVTRAFERCLMASSARRQLCLEVLAYFCRNAKFECDGEIARSLANVVLLSNPPRFSLTSAQSAAIRISKVLTEVQRLKLLDMAEKTQPPWKKSALN